MSRIVLATLNARYAHAAFGLRYLAANLEEMRDNSTILEFDISQRPLEIVEKILSRDPELVGLGVYIWNVEATTQVAALLKKLRPALTLVLGGPEVSWDSADLPLVALADHVIAGEADLAFRDLCRARLRDGERPPHRVEAPLPDLERVALPYHLYTDEDLRHRVIYVEASRGCPFTCEFCLSSRDDPVRQFPLESFLGAMQSLLDRGATRFKFVDRTFNLNIRIATTLLEFFLERMRPGLFLHFEMIPDRFPAPLRELVARFPPGSVQLEVGIQTFDDAVSRRISRRQDNDKVEENLRHLRSATGVHLHADLIVGLPGEDLATIAAGFDRLVSLDPHEIQVGILKKLRGTPIARHDAEWGMVYSPHAPYEILENRQIDFPLMQRLRRFARYWDLVANGGHFPHTTPLLWESGSPFGCFLAFSDWLFAATGQTHAIARLRLAELLFRYLTEVTSRPVDTTAQILASDLLRDARADLPPFLRQHVSFDAMVGLRPVDRKAHALPARQRRHHEDKTT